MKKRGLRGLGWIACAALVIVMTLGCSLYRNDRCYIPDDQYAKAREMFIQSGSLDLVERQLTDMEWRRCRINEAIYRLQKEFEVLPEEVPAPQAQGI
jgi:hypothetical protein